MTLSEWLEATHTTRKELAEKLGVSQSMICQVLSGKRLFRPRTAAKLIQLTKGRVTFNALYAAAKRKGAA